MSEAELKSRSFHLLALAKNIRHYEEALSQARGEQFNIFDIIQVGDYEVRTHSPMLAEILNPQGSHGQGAVFLKLFLAGLNIQDFESETARVNTEISIGDLGRIDIEITDRKDRRVVIENKIYAGLQDKQLERYHQYDPKSNLLFLTLNGDAPADGTDKTVVPNLQLVSYKSDIVRWLECCRKEVATAPCVREAITQYIHLIQRLTQQNTSTHMNHELIEAVLKDKETYMAYAHLRNTNGHIRNAIVSKLNTQLETFAHEQGLETLKIFAGDGRKYDGCFFTTPAMKSKNLKFGLECQVSDYRDFCFGFTYLGPDQASPLQSQVVDCFKKAFPSTPFDSSPGWPVCPVWGQHRYWNDDTMAAIISGDFFHEIKALIIKLAAVAAEADKSSTVKT